MKTDLEHALEYHSQAFPGFRKWLRDNPAQTKFMAKALGHLTREQLERATDALYNSDDQPRGFGSHARALRRLANLEHHAGTSAAPTGPELKDGQLVASCPRCQDYGLVNVLRPETVRNLRSDAPRSPLTTCTLVCDCRAGNGRRGVRWAPGHFLVPYPQLLDQGIARKAEFDGDTDEAMWQIAKDQVAALEEDLRTKPIPLDEVEF